MKTVLLKGISILLLLFYLPLNAQITLEGDSEYGRIFDIIYDPLIPNKLYGLTIGNHIITSSDKGQTWSILYSYPEHQAELKDLVYRPDHTLSFFVNQSTATDGVYIYNIETGTISQSYIPPVPTGSTQSWVSSYAIHEVDANYALIHQTYLIGIVGFAKVYYTTNGGTSWTEVYYNENYDTVFPNQVAISPDNPSKLYIARGNGKTDVTGGMLISNDGGITWNETLAGITLDALVFHPDDAAVMMVGTWIGTSDQEEKVYRSADGGTTWIPLNIVWHNAVNNYINTIAFNPYNTNQIIVLEENEIVISHDGGQNWNNYVYAINNSLSYSNGTNVSFSPFVVNELFINADYHPQFSSDGGITLTKLPAVFYPVTMVGFFDGVEDHLYHSVQGGLAHKNMNTQTTNNFDILPINQFSNNEPRQYFVDNKIAGRVYSFQNQFFGSTLKVSFDYGANSIGIFQTFGDTLLDICSNPQNPLQVWATFLNSGILVFDLQDLNNVTSTPIILPDFGIATAIVFNGASGEELFISTTNAIFKSTDAGMSWTQCSNGIQLTDEQIIFDLAINPFNPAEIVAASTIGIFKSGNGGAQWELVHESASVRKIAFSNINDGAIVASSYSSFDSEPKIIYSINHGNNWTEISGAMLSFSGAFAMDYHFENQSVNVYIGTPDLGLVKYTIDFETLSLPGNDLQTISVYPNPTSGLVTVGSLQGELISEIAIVSMNGATLIKKLGAEVIDLTSLAKGVYIMKVTTMTGKEMIKKVVKN